MPLGWRAPGVDFINICARNFRAHRMRSFFWRTSLANGAQRLANNAQGLANSAQICRIFANKLGKFQLTHLANFSAVWGRMLVKLNGEFFAESCAPANFCLAKKVWWNQPLVYKNCSKISKDIASNKIIFYCVWQGAHNNCFKLLN